MIIIIIINIAPPSCIQPNYVIKIPLLQVLSHDATRRRRISQFVQFWLIILRNLFYLTVMVEGQSGYSSSHCKASSRSVCNHSCPGSSPSSDCTFSSSDIENDPVSRQSGKLPWTRRHCAAFLSNEGPKVERVFKWQPYSFSAKVDEPMGSTGISAKSQRVS